MHHKLAFAILSLVPLASSAQTIERPTPKVGDECSYDVLDNQRGKEKVAERRGVVTAVNAERITISWTQKILVSRDTEDLEDGTWIYDKNLNVIQRNSRKFNPAYPSRVYPLTPGVEKKDARSNYPRLTGDGDVSVSVDGKAGNWEKVTVPAGTFDGLKITWKGDYTTTSGLKRWGGLIEHEVVLSPATWCSVAGSSRSTRGSGGNWNDRSFVLTSSKN